MLSASLAMPITVTASFVPVGMVSVAVPAVADKYNTFPLAVQFQVSSLAKPFNKILPFALAEMVAVAMPTTG